MAAEKAALALPGRPPSTLSTVCIDHLMPFNRDAPFGQLPSIRAGFVRRLGC
jgi:hypothetical protein